ncbi:MAG: sterol desaturase family protein [Cellvibrionaceae bacterium]
MSSFIELFIGLPLDVNMLHLVLKNDQQLPVFKESIMSDKQQGYEYKARQVEDMSDRAFRFGDGKISGYLSCGLGVFSFLAVLCYLFPSYLTTTDLRAAYDGETLKLVLMAGIWASLGFALLTFALGRHRRLGAIGVVFAAIALFLGGYNVPVGSVEPSPLSLGLDWLILSLIASVILFIFLEKIFPKYKDQAILRPEWELDFGYFCFNHLLIAILLLVGNYFVSSVFGWAANSGLQAWLQSLPILIQVLMIVLCADFVLYWSHRLFHEVPRLWPFHAVHHSVEYMDWLAGSRNHLVQTIIDRSIAMVPLYLLGPDKAALDIYVTFAALQAVIVHSNFDIRWGLLKYIIVTPQYHHWHHSSDDPAIDTNYAVHLPLYDRLFGTYHMPTEHWPEKYGTVKPLPKTFLGQLAYPFKKQEP